MYGKLSENVSMPGFLGWIVDIFQNKLYSYS